MKEIKIRELTYEEAKDLYDRLVIDGYPTQIWYDGSKKVWRVEVAAILYYDNGPTVPNTLVT